MSDYNTWRRILWHQGGRGVGKTHQAALAMQAVGRGAVLVCRDQREAARIKATYPGDYEAVSVTKPENLIGLHKDFVFDPDAYLYILEAMEKEHQDTISRLRKELTRKPKEQP